MGKTRGSGRAARRSNRARSKAAAYRPIRVQADPSLGFPTIPLEELARQQQAKPITDLDDIGSLWPEQFDPDEFLVWLTAERKLRRRLDADKIAEVP